ncbi:MAG: outer membrane beta-barrel protein [Beijerinckiaceae bacterium]|nr:outer membrane beta-barrel protein [Beijerinckiaceae bacterium]
MAVRSNFRAVLYLAAALQAVWTGEGAWAQEGPANLPGPGASDPTLSDPRPLGSEEAPSSSMPAAVALPAAPTDTDAPPAPAPSALPAADQATPDDAKAKPKKSKLYKPNPKSSPPLKPLEPYRTAPLPPKSVTGLPEDSIDPKQPAPTVAVIPGLPHPRKPVVDDDPFAPLGVGIGDLRLFPFVELNAGYETNPNDSNAAVRSSPEARTEAGFDLRSNFSSGSVTASLRGGYAEYPGDSDANRPDGSGLIDGRIDVTRNDKIDLEGRFTLATQTPGSPLLAVPGSTYLINRPIILTDGATVGATHSFNRLSISLRGTFDRTQYGDGTESDGSIYRFSQDDYNDFGVIARAAYELTPALIPFTEVGYDTRIHDNPIDLSGYARDSNGVTAKVGSTFEFTRLLTGNATLGYADRHYADSRLQDLRGPTVDGTLIYTITPLTTATLRASTFLTETTLPGATGAISRSIGLELAHALFRDFTVSAAGAFQVNQYQGIAVDETFAQATLKATYKLSREVQIFGSLTHQSLASSLEGSSFTNTIFLLGVRLQR